IISDPYPPPPERAAGGLTLGVGQTPLIGSRVRNVSAFTSVSTPLTQPHADNRRTPRGGPEEKRHLHSRSGRSHQNPWRLPQQVREQPVRYQSYGTVCARLPA